MKVDEIFTLKAIAKNLENIRSAVSKDLETMPEKTSEMKETLALLSSEKYDLWTSALDKTVAILPKKEEIKSLLEKEKDFDRLWETLNTWKTVFEQLPPDSNPESISTFTVPEYDKFDFSVFSSPDRIKSIFSLTKEAIECMQRVTMTCERFRVMSKVPQINDMIKAYDDLFRVLKNPSEPVGDPALISRRNEKTLVSIPLDVVLAKTEYLKGIEPTPLVHRPEKLGDVNFIEEIARVQKEIGPCRAELKKAKNDLSEVKKLLKKIKQLRDNLKREIDLSKNNRERSKKSLEKLVEEWKNAYHHLCEVFKLDREEIDLSCSDSIEPASQLISEKYARAQEILESDLTQHMKDYPEILEKYKGQKPMDIVKRVTKEFEEKIKTIMAYQEEYKKINEWILANNNQIRALENRARTRDIMTLGVVISLEILSRIHEKADIKRIVEELADRIELNVRDVYSKIFPEDESFSFKHLEEGQFLSAINNAPITHPSGSQRVAISTAIMLSLGETFGLPILLDEAFDRIDVNRLRFFSEFITGIAESSQTPQICLAGFTTFNIEKNPDVLHFVKNWRVYLVKRTKALEKNIELTKFSDN
jgi:tetratricopeptide (TPR) repeat protein